MVDRFCRTVLGLGRFVFDLFVPFWHFRFPELGSRSVVVMFRTEDLTDPAEGVASFHPVMRSGKNGSSRNHHSGDHHNFGSLFHFLSLSFFSL